MTLQTNDYVYQNWIEYFISQKKIESVKGHIYMDESVQHYS